MTEDTAFTHEAAEDQIEEARRQVDKGGSRFAGMSYEQGVIAALEWALGDVDEIPYPES